MNINEKIRERSIFIAKRFNVNVPKTLPLLDEPNYLRNSNEIIKRIMAMNVAAAVASGFNNKKAKELVKAEKLLNYLTTSEHDYIYKNVGLKLEFQLQIEAIWALCWAAGIVKDMDFSKECANDFVTLLPNLNINETSVLFSSKVKIRPMTEIIQECDLAYCLHWAIKESNLYGKLKVRGIKDYIVIERRKALEWLICDCKWEEISLDT
jgi:hypothetical protein